MTRDNSSQKQGYAFGLFLIVALFLMWGVANNLNDILIAQFKKAFELTDFQSGLVQSAFYFGYFCFAIPAAIIMRRFGFRSGVIVGLLLYALGAFLFVPAAEAQEYSYFLAALFVIASGLAFLETSANPFIAALGPPETADRRLNFAQAFNPLGAISGVIIGKYFIFSGVELTEDERAAMAPDVLDAYLASEVKAVEGPYVIIGTVVIIWAIMVLVAKFPKVEQSDEQAPDVGVLSLVSSRYKTAWFGVLTQFFYVGAQVGIWSYLIRYAQQEIPGMAERTAADYLTASLVLFTIGRFVGTALMTKVSAPRLMQYFAIINVALMAVTILVGGQIGLYSLVAASFFMSIMFPTIFSVSLRGLKTEIKSVSSLLVMAIIGGAILTAAMGQVSDASAINWAFIVPLVSFVVIAVFAASAPKVSGASDAPHVMVGGH